MSDQRLISPRIAIPLLVGLAIGIVILGVYYAMIHQPRMEEQQQAVSQQRKLQTKVDKLKDKAAGKNNTLLALNRLCDLRDERLLELPTTIQEQDAQFALEEFARQARIQNVESSWKPPENTGPRIRHRLTLNGQGSFDAATKFVELLKLDEYKFKIHSISLATPKSSSGAQRQSNQAIVEMTWIMDAYTRAKTLESSQWCDKARNDGSKKPAQ